MIFRIKEYQLAYPLALRQRAVTHYQQTDSTPAETGKLFKIGIATLRIYLRRDEENNLVPKVYQRGKKLTISDEHLNMRRFMSYRIYNISLP